MTTEKIRTPPITKVPTITINPTDVKVIKKFEELESLLGRTVIVRNKIRPGDIRLIGTLSKTNNAYFIEGIDFIRQKDGTHTIIRNGINYRRNTPAKYGIQNEAEFAERYPVFIEDPEKSQKIQSKLEQIKKLPSSVSMGR